MADRPSKNLTYNEQILRGELGSRDNPVSIAELLRHEVPFVMHSAREEFFGSRQEATTACTALNVAAFARAWDA